MSEKNGKVCRHWSREGSKMTENEAKKILYTMRLAAGLDDFEKPGGVPVPLTKEELADACKLAIKALGEVQQYRAIGTPEECRKSVDICKAMAERRLSLENIENYMKFEDECVKRGFTFNSLLEAREKQEPKEPTDRCMYKECPACGEVEIQFCKYCPSCGQKLDWRNEE